MLPERVQVPALVLVTDVMLTPLLLTILPAISAPPAPVPCRVRVLLPAPVAVKLLVNFSKPDALLAVIVAAPVVPAMLMVRFVVCPVPVKVKAALCEEPTPKLIVVPAPAALTSFWFPIDVRVMVPPPMVRFPVKELLLFERIQRLLAAVVTVRLPVPSEIRPVISLVFVVFAEVAQRVRVFNPAVAELMPPPIINLLELFSEVFRIFRPPYIESGALMVMVVLVAVVELNVILPPDVMSSALPFVEPTV